MLEPNRVKQTARKSTGGRPPKPRSSVTFSSGSTDSSPTVQRQVVARARQTDESGFFNNLLSNMAEVNKQGEPRSGERGPTSHTSAPELDGVQMWSAPTSNVRGGDEADEIAAGPSAPARNSADSLRGSDSQSPKRRPQCTRCKNMKSSPVCEPAPNSKKCLKCHRDHRICSWAVDVSGSPSYSGSPHSEDVWDSSDSELEDEVPHQRGKSAPMPSRGDWYKEINGKCLRCASFSNNPICERSDNPHDLKCTKCRRDKQSCSFAPYNGKRRPKNRIITEDGGDETDGSSEQEGNQISEGMHGEKGKGKGRENPSTKEPSEKGKADVGKPNEENLTDKDPQLAKEKSSAKGGEMPSAVKADKSYEKGKMKDIERAKEKEKTGWSNKAKEAEKSTEKRKVKGQGGRKEGDKEGPMKEERKITKDRGEGTSGNVKESKEKVSKPNETAAQKRKKKDTDLETEHGHIKKRPRLSGGKAPMVNPKSAVSSSSNSRAGPASSPIVAKHASRSILERAGSTVSEIDPRDYTPEPRASTVVQGPSTAAGAIAPSVPKFVLDRDVKENTVSCGPSQTAPMEVDEDRSIAVIERELSAAERKAALHRDVAASILRDAEGADREVAKLKEELIAVVRRQKGAEGSAAERRRLIEMLCGRGDV